jgi:predicted transcriptional regulator
MARLICKGYSVQQVANLFEVTLPTVRMACKENGVKDLCGRLQTAPRKTYLAIAMLLNTKKTFEEIGLALDLSKGRVKSIYNQCRKAKIRVKRKRGRPTKS